jgi:hypothetical protein
MQLTEQYCAKLGYTRMYLSTHDQCTFYTRCGYENCAPVCVIGSNARLLDGEQFATFRQTIAKSFGDNATATQQSIFTAEHGESTINVQPMNNQSCKPVPPPPPPPIPSQLTNESQHPQTQYMNKCIAP